MLQFVESVPHVRQLYQILRFHCSSTFHQTTNRGSAASRVSLLRRRTHEADERSLCSQKATHRHWLDACQVFPKAGQQQRGKRNRDHQSDPSSKTNRKL